jgi:hypothetical protein
MGPRVLQAAGEGRRGLHALDPAGALGAEVEVRELQQSQGLGPSAMTSGASHDAILG